MKKETIKTATTVVVGFALAFLVVGTSPSFQACIYEHQNHAGGGPLQEHVSRLLSLYKIGRGCGGEWLHKHGEGVIALFTVILGIATWLLWRATKKLVEGADATAEHQLRAYVFPDKVQQIESDGRPFTASVVIQNFGQTPAYAVSQWCAIGIECVPPSIPLREPPGDLRKSVGTYAPGQRSEFEIPLVEEPSEAIKKKIVAEKMAVYVFGEIKYRDVFGKHERWTRYRFLSKGVGFTKGHFGHDTEGNQSDQE